MTVEATHGQLKVSCIVPVYNTAHYLGEAIESALRQTYPVHEVIVVDDGSTDQSEAIARSFGLPVHYLSQERSGAPAARNRGILAAAGDFISFLDADDRWLPEKLARQIDRLASDPAPGAVSCMIQTFWIPELDHLVARLPEAKRQPLPSYGFSTMVMRRSVLQQVGLLDTRQTYSDAFEWMLRARALGVRVDLLPEVLAERRIHHHNVSRTAGPANRQEHLVLLKRELDRRRSPASVH